MTAPIPVHLEPLRLWLVDRSRYEQEHALCNMARYLEYHSGPTGYGIRLKRESMPLLTGTHVHLPITRYLEAFRRTNGQPDVDDIRAAISAGQQEYTTIVERRGFRNVDPENTERVLREQLLLCEGLFWAFYYAFAGWFLEQYRIISIEQEEECVIDCTCGLGDRVLGFWDHHARGCDGIGLMGRADIIGEKIGMEGTYCYVELKTTGMTSEPWESKWETKLQFGLGALGAERRLEKPITEHYVVGLIKGRSEKWKDPYTKVEPGYYYQNSPLVYGYCNPGEPPLSEEDWKATYFYTDEVGKNRAVSKKHVKRGIWEARFNDPEVLAGLSLSEYWCRWIGTEVLGQQLRLIGPMNRQRVMIEALADEVKAGEREWQGKVWEAYEAYVACGQYFGHPDFQATLRRLFPRSWECRRYGARHECSMARVCWQQDGWDDPLGSGYYIDRRPHHQAELDQAVARGILPPEDDYAGEEPE